MTPAEFKLVALCPEEFSDQEIEKIFLDLEIQDEEELWESVKILEAYRPQIMHALTSRFLGIKPQKAP